MKSPKDRFIKQVKNPFYLSLFFLKSLPLGFLTGLKLDTLDETQSAVSVNYNYLNKNPFQSLYFAVLAMAGELSSGILSLLHTHKSSPSVSMLVFHMEADFTKKAVGKITFRCTDGQMIKDAVDKTLTTGEGTTVIATSTGFDEKGGSVAVFRITWTFKARKK